MLRLLAVTCHAGGGEDTTTTQVPVSDRSPSVLPRVVTETYRETRTGTDPSPLVHSPWRRTRGPLDRRGSLGGDDTVVLL